MNEVNLIVPTGWEDLTDKQLRYLFGLLAQQFPSQQIKTYCLFRWSGMQVMHRYGNGYLIRLSPRSKGEGVKVKEIVLHAEQVEPATHALDWIDTLPTLPVRLAKIGSHRAIDAQFQGVPFETFIVCDNLYQGYLATKQDNLLDELAAHLYDTKRITLDNAERVSVFYWFASLKTFFAKVFKHFFQPIDTASGADSNMFEQQQSQYEQIQNAVNAQIRALTKGDITKESEVLSLDTWRALTELDAQAREYAEISRKFQHTV